VTERIPFAVADTSVLLAAFNRSDDQHKRASVSLQHLLTTEAGETTAVQAAERIAGLASVGQVRIAQVDHWMVREAADLLRQYQGHAIGLTDAVNACLAWKLGRPMILSFDGHYRYTIGPRKAGEKHLEVLPQG
jgi:predicted nucleic acid-binding protein